MLFNTRTNVVYILYGHVVKAIILNNNFYDNFAHDPYISC